jgi:uncharacterized protein YecT (DUF1311 family)
MLCRRVSGAIDGITREKRMKRLLIAALVGTLAGSAMAGGAVENFETPAECKDTGNLKIEACLAAIGGGLDGEVESRLAAVLAASAEPDSVRAAQEAWLAYRKATCDYFAGQDGIAGVIEGLQCLRWTSWRRVKELDGLLGIVPPEEGEESASEGGIEPDFNTLSDSQYSPRAFEFGDYSWYIKKRYGAGLVEKALVARGFETETAKAISTDWDAWRYHPENGQPLMDSAPMSASDSDLQALAANFPECMRDLGKADCRIHYSIELGCRLDPPVAKACQGVFDINRSIAAGYQRDGRTASLFSGFKSNSVYSMAACIMEGGKGAGLAVFAPDNSETVTKLTFIAQPAGSASQTQTVNIETLPERDAELCSAMVGWTFDEAGNAVATSDNELYAISPESVFAQHREDAQISDPARDADYAEHLQRVMKALEEAGQ